MAVPQHTIPETPPLAAVGMLSAAVLGPLSHLAYTFDQSSLLTWLGIAVWLLAFLLWTLRRHEAGSRAVVAQVCNPVFCVFLMLSASRFSGSVCDDCRDWRSCLRLLAWLKSIIMRGRRPLSSISSAAMLMLSVS